jgi:CRP-like cAMP-binding protein
VLNFLRGVYPLSVLDPLLIMAEVWPKLMTRSFTKGRVSPSFLTQWQVLKEYLIVSDDILIIADGEVEVKAKTASHGVITVNTYGPKDLLCDQ